MKEDKTVHMLYDFIYIKLKKEADLAVRSQDSIYSWGRGSYWKGALSGFWGLAKLFLVFWCW